MSLTHVERLHVVGCGFKGRLVRLLSLGVGHHFEPQRNWGACHKLMQSIARRVTAGLASAVRDEVAKEAEELCASGRFAAAVVPLEQATNLGDLPSRALYAWVVSEGREAVAKDANRAFQLAEEGARAGCNHCQGVMAFCCAVGCGCEADEAPGLELARESSGRGSKYGQFALGWLHQHGDGGLAQDYAQAVAFYRLAAAQGLDGAQCMLGFLCLLGQGVAENYTEAQRLFQLSAAQGHPVAFFCIGVSRELGRGVRQSGAAAIRWYRRAQAAGVTDAADALRRLRA
jgi:TPR repeat protein